MANWGAYLTYQNGNAHQVFPASLIPYLLQNMAGIPHPLPLISQPKGWAAPSPEAPSYILQSFGYTGHCLASWSPGSSLSPTSSQGYVHFGVSQILHSPCHLQQPFPSATPGNSHVLFYYFCFHSNLKTKHCSLISKPHSSPMLAFVLADRTHWNFNLQLLLQALLFLLLIIAEVWLSSVVEEINKSGINRMLLSHKNDL